MWAGKPEYTDMKKTHDKIILEVPSESGKEEISCIVAWFDENMSHKSLLDQIIGTLAEAGYASENEIRSVWKDLLS